MSSKLLFSGRDFSIEATSYFGVRISAVESLAFLCQADKQRRWLPLRALVALLEPLDCVQHFVQAYGVGIEHRSAAIRRKAIAGEIDHVDVGGAQRDAFLQNVRAFVGKRVDAALDDLVVRDLPRL